MGRTQWQTFYSDLLRIDTTIDAERGNVVDFSFQLCGFLDGEWHPLVRYDNAHGTPHRHIEYPDGTVEPMTFVAVVPATFVGWVQRDIKANAQRFYDEYVRQWQNQKELPDD